MTCDRVKLPGGGMAIVCSRSRRTPRCRWCTTTPGTFQCDWKLGKGKTCDKYICAQHAQEVAPDKHLCPEHQKAYKAWLDRRGSQPAAPAGEF
jgi:hypothetical protein